MIKEFFQSGNVENVLVAPPHPWNPLRHHPLDLDLGVREFTLTVTPAQVWVTAPGNMSGAWRPVPRVATHERRAVDVQRHRGDADFDAISTPLGQCDPWGALEDGQAHGIGHGGVDHQRLELGLWRCHVPIIVVSSSETLNVAVAGRAWEDAAWGFPMMRGGPVRLVTLVDVGDVTSCRVNARCLLSLELDSGEQIPLLTDRGWASSQLWTQTTLDGMEIDAREAVGPEPPFDGYTRQDMADGYWRYLAEEGPGLPATVTADTLSRLPHGVEFTPAVVSRVQAAQRT